MGNDLHQKFILSKDRMKFLTENFLPAWLWKETRAFNMICETNERWTTHPYLLC